MRATALTNRRAVGAGSIDAVLDTVGADILCLQEVKLNRLGEPEMGLAICDGWDSFFSLSGRGYAGVATFCRASLRPSAVAEGLSRPLTAASPALASVAGAGFGDTGEAAVAAALSEEARAMLESEGRYI